MPARCWETADWDKPLACAIVRVDQCVPCAGRVSSVRVIKASTSASVICRGAPGRGSSARPSSRAIRKRSRHLHTVWSVIRSCRATLRFSIPSAQLSTIRARSANRCAVFWAAGPFLQLRSLVFAQHYWLSRSAHAGWILSITNPFAFYVNL